MDVKLVAKKAEEAVAPVIVNLGYSVVDCEYIKDFGRWTLRVYIEKEGGAVSVDDCSKVSRAIEGVLDVDDVIPSRYALEVSSPGLARPLRSGADFEKFAGQTIRLKTKEPVNGRSNYLGKLLGMKGNEIAINVDGTEYNVPFDLLSKARLEYKK